VRRRDLIFSKVVHGDPLEHVLDLVDHEDNRRCPSPVLSVVTPSAGPHGHAPLHLCFHVTLLASFLFFSLHLHPFLGSL
jgi:hypothetical protein